MRGDTNTSLSLFTRSTGHRRFCGTAIIAIVACCGVANAAEMRSEAAMATGATGTGAPKATDTAYAYVYSSVRGSGANVVTSGTVAIGAGAPAPIATPAVTFKTNRAGLAGVVLGDYEFNGVGDSGRLKLPAKTVNVTSTTTAAALATAKGISNWVSTAAGTTFTATAGITLIDPNTTYVGLGAAKTNDPTTLDAGLYFYGPLITAVNMINPSADGLTEAAYDCDADFALTGKLWSAAVDLEADGTVDVAFQHDSMLTLPPGVTDTTIAQDLRNALDLSTPNQVTLKSIYTSTGYTLFNATFVAPPNATFGESSYALALDQVPEPTTGIGFLGIAAGALLRRRKK